MSVHSTLPAPGSGQAYFDVSALEAGKVDLPEKFYVNDPEFNRFHRCPSLSFLLRHQPSGKLIVFDLGLRKDYENYPPSVVDRIKDTFTIKVDQDAKESLIKGGVDPTKVGHVILSHLHWDHVGDNSAFTTATFVLGDEGRPLLSPGFPGDPESRYTAETAPEGRTQWVSSTDWKPIGPFPLALDFFGDGSIYLIDAAGHLPGHLNLLVRNSPTGSWVFLGGDSMHDVRILTGEKHVAHTHEWGCAHVHPEKADAHIHRVQSLLKMQGVQVILAHHLGWDKEHPDEYLPGKIKPTA